MKKVIAQSDSSIKKHHIWGGVGIIVGIILAILVITIFSYNYLKYIENESYIRGSQDMVSSLYNTINTNGGAVIKSANDELTVVKYEKVVDSNKIVE